MSDELFEVAFSGEIVEGANLEKVKARVGKMFQADDAKIATLFSGNRIVIKKNIDQVRTSKYQQALYQAGAICEIRPMSARGKVSLAPAQKPEPERAPAPTATPKVSIETGDWGESAPPPQFDPLGITGDQIEELDATVAPVGSTIRNQIEEIPEPQFDLSELDVAPAGSDIGSPKKEPEPPPPDTSGITMAD